jgi:hypothetical protein
MDEPDVGGMVYADGQGLDDVLWVRVARTSTDADWLAPGYGRWDNWRGLRNPIPASVSPRHNRPVD